MVYSVFYMSSPPASHRAVTLSVQPAEFQDTWLESSDPSECEAKLAAADFIVTGSLSATQVARASRVRLVQMPGVGYEHINVAACQARGIPVAITPEGTTDGVAEHTILLILALYKHLAEAHAALKAGAWIHDRLRPVCLALQEKRVGIVGMGRIGRAVARRLQGWDVQIVYHDVRRLSHEDEDRLQARYLPLDELLRSADVVTLHVYLGPGSAHLIGARELGLLRPEAILINTSRGEVIDEAALYRALRDRRIAAAGIDAWTVEPTPSDNPILGLDNVLVTPHMATANRDAMVKKSEACYANFQRILRGEPPINTVEPYR